MKKRLLGRRLNIGTQRWKAIYLVNFEDLRWVIRAPRGLVSELLGFSDTVPKLIATNTLK